MLDTQTALRLLEEEVREKGEGYVYEHPNPSEPDSCYNVWQGKPSCLGGRVLIRAGVFTVEELGYGISAFAPAPQLALNFPGRIEKDAALVLRAAQEAQDRGATWGTALQEARDRAEALRGSQRAQGGSW